MQSGQTASSPEQIAQQNKLFYAKQRLKFKSVLAKVEYDSKDSSRTPLVINYNGYMQLYKRRAGNAQPTEYFSSPFLTELKEKRNNMLSDEILEKMVKNYELN